MRKQPFYIIVITSLVAMGAVLLMVQVVTAKMKRGDGEEGRAIIDVEDDLQADDIEKQYWICRDGMDFLYALDEDGVREEEGLSQEDPLPDQVIVRIRAKVDGKLSAAEDTMIVAKSPITTFSFRPPAATEDSDMTTRYYEINGLLFWQTLIDQDGILDEDGILPADSVDSPLANYLNVEFSKDFQIPTQSLYDPRLESIPDSEDSTNTSYSPPVNDCLVGTFPVTIKPVQIGLDSIGSVVTEELVFEVNATYGSGGIDDKIEYLDMIILDPDGVEVHRKTERTPAYCAFGGNTCRVWEFAENDNLWPNGTPISNGQHTLKVKAHIVEGFEVNDPGHVETWSQPISIQLPIETEFVQTAPGTASAQVSDELVFQLGAHTGISNEDGYGIARVDMEILNSAGEVVHEKQEFGAAYCAFGGNQCRTWTFSANDYQWPNGIHVQSGEYTLQATVQTSDGRSQTVQKQITIVTTSRIVHLPIVRN